MEFTAFQNLAGLA
uniref:Uncharacterized protein n=1 Tax=Anguilla anguilla TaxID=7936 RepID=A0A0E9V354_ANGAN